MDEVSQPSHHYYKGLVLFAVMVIIIAFIVIFLFGIFDSNFNEKNAVELVKRHYSPVALEDFESEIEDDHSVKIAQYIFQGPNIPDTYLPSYLGFAETTITYDDFGDIVNIHMTFVNKTAPPITPTKIWNCNDQKKVIMFTEDTEDYLALAYTGDKITEIITETFIDPATSSQISDDASNVIDNIEKAEEEIEVLLVWYYSPQKRAEYQAHLQESENEIRSYGCV